MKGLMIKDFYNLKKQLALYVIIGVIYSIIGAVSTNEGGTSFTGFIMVLSAMLSVTAVSYDERAGFDKYGLTMPVSRKETVAAKYILGILFTIAGALIAAVIGFIFRADTEEYAITIGILAGVCFLYLSVLFPIIYKFGTERARFAIIAVMLIPFFLIVGGAAIMKKTSIGVVKLPESVNVSETAAEKILEEAGTAVQTGTDSSFILGIAVFLAVSCVIMYVSYRISVKIYSNKEF